MISWKNVESNMMNRYSAKIIKAELDILNWNYEDLMIF